MSEEERKNVANIIGSILTSSTKRMTIHSLSNDFMNTVGYRIPHDKFGCLNIEQFLRTLKDKVQVIGTGTGAEVQVLISNKMAHLNELISKQKTPKQKARLNYRNSNRQPTRRNFSYPNNTNNYYRPQPLDQNQFVNNYPTSISRTVTATTSTTSYNSFSNNSPLDTNSEFKGAVPKQTIKQSGCVEEIYFSDEESRRNVRVPLYIQDNLRNLMVKYGDGILCSNISELYRKQYGKSLDYSCYGYRSIAEMCVDLKDIFNIVQLDKSDIKLFNKNAPIPEDTLNIVKKFQLMKIKASRESATENAIPDPDEVEDIMCQIHSTNTPEDIVAYGTQLEKQWIDPGTDEQDYIDVNVGEIYDPSKFWINLRTCANALNLLMDRMQGFYGLHNKDLYVPPYAIRENMYIVCIFDGEYHRAKVVDTSQKSENTVKVYFIDYGTVSVISIERVCYLHNQFGDLPEQAIRARLAGIMPPTENEQWSRAAASRFLSFVMQKDLVARIIKIDEERMILDIILADTSVEDEDFYINDALVSMGYAVLTSQERASPEPAKIVPIVRYIHLFPTHMELEHGLVPTATQSLFMHQAGMRIEQMYPHYFKDAETGAPISVLQVISNKTEDLPVDYDVDRSYNDDDKEGGAEEEVEAATSATSPNLSGNYNWIDVIEEVEIAAVEADKEEICTEDPNGDKSELSDVNASQTSFTNEFNEKSNSITISDDTQQTNIDQEGTIPAKTHSRPPPGYDHVIPHNTSVTYNYSQNPNPNSYVTNQTFINFPVYPQQLQPLTYSSYANQFYNNYYQNLLRFGATLTPEQLNYLQSLNYFNSYQYGGQPEYASSAPAGYNGMNPCPNPNPAYSSNQEMSNVNNGSSRSLNEPQNIATFQAEAGIGYNYNDVGMSNLNNDNPMTVTPPIQAVKVETVPFPISLNCSETAQNLPRDRDEILTLINEEKKEDAKLVLTNPIPHTTVDIKESNLTSAPITTLHAEIEEEKYLTIDSSSNYDISEIESVYEECHPCNEPISDRITTTPTLKPDVSYKAKLITSMNIGEWDMHAINHENEFYFLLAELSEKVFGRTLTAFHIRKLIVGTPYLISVVDIRLKTYPKLKKELLMYGLIEENAVTVDAIPIKYLKELTRMMSASDDDVDNVNDLLKGVDYFLSKSKTLETKYF